MRYVYIVPLTKLDSGAEHIKKLIKKWIGATQQLRLRIELEVVNY